MEGTNQEAGGPCDGTSLCGPTSNIPRVIPQSMKRHSHSLLMDIRHAVQVCLDYRPVNTKTVEPDNPPVPPAKRVY